MIGAIYPAELPPASVRVNHFFDLCLSATITQHIATSEQQHFSTQESQHWFTQEGQHWFATLEKC